MPLRPSVVRRAIVDDIRAARKFRFPWWAVLWWMACCAILIWPLYVHDRLDLAPAVLNSVAVCGFAIVLKWRLKRRPLFWGVMAVVAACHVPLIISVPWTTEWIPAAVIAVFDSVDVVVIIVLVDLVIHLADRRRAKS
jgi:hypothetical protein